MGTILKTALGVCLGIFLTICVACYGCGVLLDNSADRERERLRESENSRPKPPEKSERTSKPSESSVSRQPDPPKPSVPEPKFSPGDMAELIATEGNGYSWMVWHPLQFAKLEEAQRIRDVEGEGLMERERKLYFIKPGTKVRVLRATGDNPGTRKQVYEIRILGDDACRDRRVETRGLAGYTYEYCLSK